MLLLYRLSLSRRTALNYTIRKRPTKVFTWLN